MVSARIIVTAIGVAWTVVYGLRAWSTDNSLTGEQQALVQRAGRVLRASGAGNESDIVIRRPFGPKPASGIAGLVQWVHAKVSSTRASAVASSTTSSLPLTAASAPGEQATADELASGVKYVFVGDSDAPSECGMAVAVKFDCVASEENNVKVYDVGCSSQVQGYINYIMFHECTMAGKQWLSFIALIAWLLYLLWMLGDTADVFFCPTLDVIVMVLNLSPNVAGVTFLSFGNGAPDVFSSLAATLGGNPDVGVSAILGAGVFVTTVVVGAVAFASDVKLDRRPFLRDVGFYIVATVYLLFAFADHKVSLLEAIGFLVIYAVFAATVVIGRSVYQGWKKQRLEAEGKGDGDDGADKAHATPLLTADSLPSAASGEAAAGGGERRESGISLQALSKPTGALAASKTEGGGSSSVADALLDGVSGRSDNGGGRSLSIDWFFAERPKAQLAVVQEADEADTAHAGAGGDTGGDAGEAAAAGALARASSGGSKGMLRTMSKKDLALVSAQKHIKEKKRRSLMPGDASSIAAAISSRRLSDGDVRHRVEARSGFSWLEPIHVPKGMFVAHERRTKLFLRAIGYEDEKAEQRARHGHVDGPQRLHNSLNRPSAGEDGSAAMGDGESEGKASAGEEEGMCDAYCGDDTRLGVFMYWMLLPSALIRQISTPLVGEDDYQWYFVAMTPLFGFPFVFETAFVSIGSPGGILQEIGGSTDGGFSYLILSIMLGALCSAAAFWLLPRNEPPKGIVLTLYVLFAFLTSVSWIITVANEIVTLLVALGFALSVSAEILGLTVLAWGNSLGDLVADVSVARAGTPKMALAACFAGPLFNLLMGLGLSLTVQTLKEEDHIVDMTNPSGHNPLNCHQINIVWSCFGFLLLSLVSSMIVVALDGFRLRRFWGLVLIVMYVVFLGVSFVLQFTDVGCG